MLSASAGALHSVESAKAQHPSGKLVAAGGVEGLLHWDVAGESLS